MEVIELISEEELNDLIIKFPCTQVLDSQCYSKTRYIEQSEFDDLIKYILLFEPYLEIAKRCLMSAVPILRSKRTNRLYIGFVNLGGHRAMCEVRPIRIEEIKNIAYIGKMYSNNGQALDWGLDINQNYVI